MNKKKQTQPSTALFVKCTLIALIVVQLLVIMWLVSFHASTTTILNSQSKNSVNQFMDSSEIRFCYDRDIKPCDDVSIHNWNAEHPDDSFHRI